MDYRIEQLRYLLREDPSSRIFYQLGELLRREGEAEEAVEILRTGLDRHPRYVSAWVCLGRSQRDLRALEEARQSFQIALDLDRENPVAARLLGETAVELEDWLGAVKALKLTRALAGADDELDIQIAMVEGRLDEDGRLDRPLGRPRPVTPPVRCLDVVNLSTDDPFSAASEDAEVRLEIDDVFATAEVSVDAVADAEAAVEDTAEAVAAAIEVEAAAGEISVSEPDEVEEEEREPVAAAVEPETVEAPGEVAVDLAPIVDESSVGAWSTTMRAAGVSGAVAWTEPSGEIVADDAVFPDDSWTEPGAASEAVEAVAEEPPDAADVDDVAETVTDEEPRLEAEPTELEAGLDVQPEDLAPEPVAAVEVAATTDILAPPVETHEFDSIEVTHPIVIEKRVADAEDQALVEAAEEATDDEILPGEDRDADGVELTRPIPVPDLLVKDGMPPQPTDLETPPPSAGAIADDPSADDIEITDKRHELEHGVPLPTMTLAKLALEQDDRPLAMATLESLIERDPANAKARLMLDELRAQEAGFADERLRAVRATTKIAALQGWLDAVRLAAERRLQ
jgi:tetratricopeptide (TPR) repeat protein